MNKLQTTILAETPGTTEISDTHRTDKTGWRKGIHQREQTYCG
jgi:hypothetical protein